jgi:radical SAM superfamily enzyme YgiQ (UPF0313 family)
MRKTLLMIYPVQRVELPDYWNKSALKNLKYPPTNLAYLAALTPAGWDMRIIDEIQEPLTFEDADLVAITSMTPTAPRAYEISREYRERGAKTVIGGIHASMLPDEAILHADAVVVGEAESIWWQVIRDFEDGQMKGIYRGERLPFEKVVRSRRDLMTGKYALNLACVETARGCPYDCEFCSVTAFNGRMRRERPIPEVLDELEAMSNKDIFFMDDTIMSPGTRGEERAIELFRGMMDRGLKKRWYAQAGLDIAFSPEVLKWAKRSGCAGLGMGFESINEETLGELHKTRNLKIGVRRYSEGIKRMHDNGIAVAGAFVIGSDADTKAVFESTVKFVLDTGIDASEFSVLTPLPGTRLFTRLRQQGRIFRTNFPEDWIRYDFQEVVFQPKHMTPDELMQGITEAYKEMSSRITSLRRALKTLVISRSLIGGAIAYAWNRGSGEVFKQRFGEIREGLPPEVRHCCFSETDAQEDLVEASL